MWQENMQIMNYKWCQSSRGPVGGQHPDLPAEAKENHEWPQSGYLMSHTRFETWTVQIYVTSICSTLMGIFCCEIK